MRQPGARIVLVAALLVVAIEIASRIGLGQVVEVAAIGDDGVPVSLLYFVRQGA